MTEKSEFKDAISTPEEIIEDARNGRMFILVDHEDRDPLLSEQLDERLRNATPISHDNDARAFAELDAGRLADLLAYRTYLESVREWPFDDVTLRRFLLYLLIPVGSWLGGALVERLVSQMLD